MSSPPKRGRHCPVNKLTINFMKKYLTLLAAATVVLMSGCDKDDGGATKEERGDYATFREYCSAKFDTPEIWEFVDEMDIGGYGWSDIEGIDKFAGLRKLDCSGNSIGALELSQQRLRYLDCSDCALTQLVVASPELETLICSGNELRLVDLTHCRNLKKVVCKNNGRDGGGKLQVSIAMGVNPTTDFDGTAFVQEFDMGGGKPSYNDEPFWQYCLQNFDEDKDGQISDEEAAKVTSIEIADKGLKNVEGIHRFTNLETLYCSGNDLPTLDLSKLSELYEVNCANSKISTLIVESPKLKVLDCSQNSLTELDVAKCVKLNTFDCCGNQLSFIDISKCDSDIAFYCRDNVKNMWIKITFAQSRYANISKDSTAYFVQDEYGIGNTYTVYANGKYVQGKVFALTDNIGAGGAVGIASAHGYVISDKVGAQEWSNEKFGTNATDEENGANNVAKIKQIEDWADKYPAFRVCDDLGDGWYLPSVEELRLANRNALQLNSGVLVSSTERDSGYGYYVELSTTSALGGNRLVLSKITSHYVRCVLKF